MRRLISILSLFCLCTVSGAVQAVQFLAPGIEPDGSRAGYHLVADTDTGDSSTSETEVAIWNTIKSTENLALLRAFVKTYPDSIFTPITRVMITNLDPTAPDEQIQENPVSTDSTMEETAEPVTETAALPEPEKEKKTQYDGTWQLAGSSHSFKRYQAGICRNPDSLNQSFTIDGGEIDAVLTSKTRNTVSLKGNVTKDGILNLKFRSGITDVVFQGKYETELKPDVSNVKFSQKLVSDGQSWCWYDFVLKRIR
ncbi:MAG: hypothetical protein RIM72_04200 [Alphaproteobacteria bacterium]